MKSDFIKCLLTKECYQTQIFAYQRMAWIIATCYSLTCLLKVTASFMAGTYMKANNLLGLVLNLRNMNYYCVTKRPYDYNSVVIKPYVEKKYS